MAAGTNRFEQRYRVSWSDLDGNAHMGNTSYLGYASNTRVHYFTEHGFPPPLVLLQRGLALLWCAMSSLTVKSSD